VDINQQFSKGAPITSGCFAVYDFRIPLSKIYLLLICSFFADGEVFAAYINGRVPLS
jgi:hypothetical protein